MLDKLFLSKLNKQGKVMYFIGQFTLLGIGAFLLFAVFKIDFEDVYIWLIVGALAIVVIWGLICIKVWPLEKVEESLAGNQPVSYQQAPPSPKDPFGPNPGMKR